MTNSFCKVVELHETLHCGSDNGTTASQTLGGGWKGGGGRREGEGQDIPQIATFDSLSSEGILYTCSTMRQTNRPWSADPPLRPSMLA